MNLQNQPDKDTHKRTVIAFVLCGIIMLLWQVFYEVPVRHQRELALQAQKIEQEKQAAETAAKLQSAPQLTTQPAEVAVENVDNREQVIANSPRIKIDNGELHGSIRLVGARFDDLTLAHHKQTIEKNSPEVVLMSPSGSKAPNFIETGWIATDGKTKVPDANAAWQSSAQVLSQNSPVTLTWDNGAGVVFVKKISLDEKFMFAVEDSVQNNSGTAIGVAAYGLISKSENKEETPNKLAMIHTGGIGVVAAKLEELSYKTLREDGEAKFDKTAGWLGFSDQYWLKAIVPSEEHKLSFKYFKKDELEKFQADYLTDAKTIPAAGNLLVSTKIFAGAKELSLLENYSEKYDIKLFDRAVHFGSFYFLSKPFTHILNYFYEWFGNFGLAIFGLTFCVKLALFPLARKSYISMGKLKVLGPKMKELQARYKEDKMELQKKMLELYKKEKVNPASGCLPILLQIPVFIALYRVFIVNIDMRHAPFFGWVHDLSAPDPTSWWNLFGALPFESPAFLAIGIWPLVMAGTMYIQQMLTPTPADATQAQVMRFMPLLFLFMFHSFPVGLVIYWCFSNTLTIFQQVYFLKVHGHKH